MTRSNAKLKARYRQRLGASDFADVSNRLFDSSITGYADYRLNLGHLPDRLCLRVKHLARDTSNMKIKPHYHLLCLHLNVPLKRLL